MVRLIPLYAVEVLPEELLDEVPDLTRRMKWYLDYKPELHGLVAHWEEKGAQGCNQVSLLRGHRMKTLLRRIPDETEFLSGHGVRALSRAHTEDPYVFDCTGERPEVGYWPAESLSGLFGGNSNCREHIDPPSSDGEQIVAHEVEIRANIPVVVLRRNKRRCSKVFSIDRSRLRTDEWL